MRRHDASDDVHDAGPLPNNPFGPIIGAPLVIWLTEGRTESEPGSGVSAGSAATYILTWFQRRLDYSIV